jgi:hypothetical protein
MGWIDDLKEQGRLRIDAQHCEKLGYKRCNRCRNYGPDVDYSTYWLDTLCGRCARVLCELEEQGKWKPGQQNEPKDAKREKKE